MFNTCNKAAIFGVFGRLGTEKWASFSLFIHFCGAKAVCICPFVITKIRSTRFITKLDCCELAVIPCHESILGRSLTALKIILLYVCLCPEIIYYFKPSYGNHSDNRPR